MIRVHIAIRPRLSGLLLGFLLVVSNPLIPADASKPWPKQLRGISNVNLYVHMPSSLSEGDRLAVDLRSKLETVLNEAGIDTNAASSQFLAVDVDLLPYNACEKKGIVGVRMLVRLSEPVRLLRDSEIREFDKMPITWFEERLFVSPVAELEGRIKQEAIDLVEQFAGWIMIQRR